MKSGIACCAAALNRAADKRVTGGAAAAVLPPLPQDVHAAATHPPCVHAGTAVLQNGCVQAAHSQRAPRGQQERLSVRL